MSATKPTRTLSKAGPSAATAGWGILIFRLARMTGHRLGEALTALDMRTHEFAVLHHLEVAGPLSQQDVAAALRINPSNLVGLLDALEADGLILRPRDPADRRRHLVELTAAGRQRLARAKQAAAAAEQELLTPLSERERKAFQGMLERLATHACGGAGRRGRAC